MTTRTNAVRPAAHKPGQLYTYYFSIYHDYGARREMRFVRDVAVMNTDRARAAEDLGLAPDERAVWI